MKIVVVGSGVSAMVASWVCRSHDLVCWSPSGRFGGQFASGPFRLVRATQAATDMLDQLDLAFETHDSQPGIILADGSLLPLPDGFATVRSRDAAKMRQEYITKSRGAWAVSREELEGMAEPERHPDLALDFDFASFRRAIADDTEIRQGQLVDLDPQRRRATFRGPSGDVVESYDSLIFTCPSEVVYRALPVRHAQKMPQHVTSAVDIVHVVTPDGVGAAIDRLVGFDVVWIPATPAAFLMRLSHETDGYACEFKAGATLEEIKADLAFALPFGHSHVKIDRGLRGIVTHDREAGELPKDVHAAGPHATGYMCTLDETLDRMMELFA